MKKLLDFLRHGAFGAACAFLVLSGVLLTGERSGWLRESLERELSGRLGEPVRIDDVHLRWFRPAVEIRGLSFGDDREGLWIERLTAVLGPGRGSGIREIRIGGGHVVLSSKLADRVRRITETAGLPKATRGRAGGGVLLPTIVLRDVQVDLSHPEWGELPIGLVDALCVNDHAGNPIIEGRIVPNLAQGGGPSEIYLRGHELEPGWIEITGSTAGVAVTVDTLREGTALEVFRPYAPRGRLELDGRVRFSIDGSRPPYVWVRAALTEGAVLPPTTDAPVEDLRVDLTATFQPGAEQDITTPEAWVTAAWIRAKWKDTPIDGWAFFGRNAGPGLWARGWVHARDVPLSLETPRVLGLEEKLATTWTALDPRGVAGNLVVAVRMPVSGAPEVAVELVCDGRAGVSYVGFPNRDGECQGVPLPVEEAAGRLLIQYSAEQSPAARLAFLDATGRGASEGTTAWAEGLIVTPSEGQRVPRLDIRYGGSGIPIDDALREALQGLRGTGFIWPTFRPEGGSGSFETHMMLSERTDRLATHLSFEFEGARAAFADLPVPLADAKGRVELLFESRGAGIGFELEGRSATSDRISVRGRLQDDPGWRGEGGRDRWQVTEVQVAVENIALRGADRDILTARLPGVGFALDEMGAAGKVDLDYRVGIPRPGAAFEHHVEVSPRRVQVFPRRFKIQTRNARGRVLITAVGEGFFEAPAEAGDEPSPQHVVARVQPLVGDWPGETVVAMVARFDSQLEGRIRLFGAGLDPSNLGLAGAIGEALPAARGGRQGALNLSTLAVEGRVDFTGEVILPHGEEPIDRYRVHLRENDFRTGTDPSFELTHLAGILEQRDEVLHGEGLRAILGRTQVFLETARFSVGEDGHYRAELAPRARGLPLDREHMRFFLDEATANTLVDELGLWGRIDVHDATLLLTGGPSGGGRLEFRGRMTPTDMFVDLGLPMEVAAASIAIERLVLEDGHVRAWMTVEDLDGRVADRDLTGARLALTYVEPRLSVLALDGQLERGRVRNLSGDAAPAFSIDLKEPFRFDLAVQLLGVDVAELLQGLFESEFASRGELNAELRLNGSLDRLTGIRGDGMVELQESTLWSIPVMRDLFSQLGFDQTAVFDEMKTHFELEDGVIEMAMDVRSPLLRLVGHGTLDLDGSLHHDLRVQYSLVDKLGPFTRLIYFVQNNLLRVSVRGDMARPQVILQGALAFLQRFRRERGRDLPLPGFAAIPERF